MLITLEQWAAKTFSEPPKLPTLRAWAKSGQINPLPKKAGRRYFVEETAQFRPLDDVAFITKDPVVIGILNGSKAA